MYNIFPHPQSRLKGGGGNWTWQFPSLSTWYTVWIPLHELTSHRTCETSWRWIPSQQRLTVMLSAITTGPPQRFHHEWKDTPQWVKEVIFSQWGVLWWHIVGPISPLKGMSHHEWMGWCLVVTVSPQGGGGTLWWQKKYHDERGTFPMGLISTRPHRGDIWLVFLLIPTIFFSLFGSPKGHAVFWLPLNGWKCNWCTGWKMSSLVCFSCHKQFLVDSFPLHHTRVASMSISAVVLSWRVSWKKQDSSAWRVGRAERWGTSVVATARVFLAPTAQSCLW